MDKFGFRKPSNSNSDVSISDRLLIISRRDSKPTILYSKCNLLYGAKDAYFELEVALPGEIAIGFSIVDKKEMKKREFGSPIFNQTSYYYQAKDGIIIGNFFKRIAADWYSSPWHGIGDTVGCAVTKNGEFVFVTREGIKSVFQSKRCLTGVTLTPFVVVGAGAVVAVNVGHSPFKHGLAPPSRPLSRSRDAVAGPTAMSLPSGVFARGSQLVCAVDQNQTRTCCANRPLVLGEVNHVPYFEVKVTHVEGTLAVGLMPHDAPTAQPHASIGLANNGNCYVHAKYSRWLAGFYDGDTIGCGLALNSFNQLCVFFTKNGHFLDFAPGTMFRPRDVVPAVRLANHCAVSVNFDRSSFRWNVNEWPVYEQINSFDTLPAEIKARILMFAAETKSFACLILALVSRELSELSRVNVVWKRLYLRAFPYQNKKLRVKNWYQFFKRRFLHERYWGKTTFESLSIENCNQGSDKCPLTWRELQLTTDNTIRVCNACKTRRLVYLVHDVNKLKEHYDRGHLAVYNNTQPKLEEVYSVHPAKKQ